MLIKEASYEVSEPTVDSQIVTLQGSGADVFLIAATPKFAAQAIRKAYRHRLEAGALHDRRLAIGRDGDEAGGHGEIEGRDHRGLRQGSDRRPMEGRRRLQGIQRVHRRNTCRPKT